MVSIPFFEIRSESHIVFRCRFCGNCRLINHVFFHTLSLQWAIWLILQLHVRSCCESAAVALSWASMISLCDEMKAFMFSMHEQLSLRVCLLKILFDGWFFGKHLSTMSRNFLPRLVLTLLSHGGLYQVIFSFPGFALSRCPRCLQIEFKFVVVATFSKRLLVWVQGAHNLAV